MDYSLKLLYVTGRSSLLWRSILRSSSLLPHETPCFHRNLSLSSHRNAATDESTPLPAPSGKTGPIQFSTSQAFKHKVYDANEEDPARRMNLAFITGSLAVFMIYFFYLREENAIDKYMETPLWDKVPGLEKQTVIALIMHQEKTGKDTTVARRRLREIEEEETAGLAPSWRKTRVISIQPSVPSR